MKQIEEMKQLGYVGNVRQRNKTFDKELYTTHASELTLAEKQNRSKRQVSTSTGKTKEAKEAGNTNVKTTVWIIGFLATVAFFINSKTGRENIKRLVTDCGRPTPIQFGSAIVNEHEGTKYGSKASVVCSTGFTSSEPETVCQANGKWSSVYCHMTDCGKTLPSVKNGHLTINKEQDTTYGAMATVTCAPGYQRNKHTIACQADGLWEEALCQPVNCGKTLPAVKNGHLTINKEQDTTYGAMATMACAPGYQRNKHTISCQADGLWEEALCQPVNCGKTLPAVKNGHLTINKKQDTTYGAMATVTCAPGYQRNKHTISCQADGLWEEALCQPVNCGIPEIKHGHLEMDSTLYLSQAYVKCDPGYAPSQPTATCSASRVWQNAHCYNIDDCTPNPCLNGGECVDEVADFSCQCKQWYSGKTCEIITGPCANHQCKNGGTCVANPNGGGYTCNCPVDIDGNFCESPHPNYYKNKNRKNK